jgi:integrase
VPPALVESRRWTPDVDTRAATVTRLLSIAAYAHAYRSCTIEYRPLAELLIGGGLRISQALAVEIDDIDQDRQLIYVCRQARRGTKAKRGGRQLRDIARTKGKDYRQGRRQPPCHQCVA